MDSAALAHWLKPEAVLFIDYGQGPATAERRSAELVARDMGAPWAEVSIDCSMLGPGLLARGGVPGKPRGEAWWPYRNQLLATFASAWALGNGLDQVLLGTVVTDGRVHRDGTPWFVESLDSLVSGQEGGLRILAPAISMTTEQLLDASGISISALAATYSCHTSSLPCGDCGGCTKRDQILRTLAMS